MKIIKGDTVKMILGKDAGKTGKVLRSSPEKRTILVEGLNLVKKHARAKKQGEKGQRTENPRFITVSNVLLICPKCGQAVRVGYKIIDGKKIRVCKKCSAEV